MIQRYHWIYKMYNSSTKGGALILTTQNQRRQVQEISQKMTATFLQDPEKMQQMMENFLSRFK
jgi:predicted transcriptional regulator